MKEIYKKGKLLTCALSDDALDGIVMAELVNAYRLQEQPIYEEDKKLLKALGRVLKYWAGSDWKKLVKEKS